MDEEEKLCAYTWQIALVSSLVVFIAYIILSSQCVHDFLMREIPDPIYRTVAVGMILSLIVFLFLGTMTHYISPVKEHPHPKNSMSPIAFVNR